MELSYSLCSAPIDTSSAVQPSFSPPSVLTSTAPYSRSSSILSPLYTGQASASSTSPSFPVPSFLRYRLTFTPVVLYLVFFSQRKLIILWLKAVNQTMWDGTWRGSSWQNPTILNLHLSSGTYLYLSQLLCVPLISFPLFLLHYKVLQLPGFIVLGSILLLSSPWFHIPPPVCLNWSKRKKNNNKKSIVYCIIQNLRWKMCKHDP